MKLRVIFWLILGFIISSLLFWQNSKIYRGRSILWRVGKSIIEIGIILLSALRLPVILISWCTLWITRPIKTIWIKVTVATIAGLILGLLGMYALEALIIIAIFSIDDITGEREGFLNNWNKAVKSGLYDSKLYMD